MKNLFCFLGLICGMINVALAHTDDPGDAALKLLSALQTQGQELAENTATLTTLLAPLAEVTASPLAGMRDAASNILTHAKVGLVVPHDPGAIQYALTMIKVDVGIARSSLTRLNVALADKPVSPDAKSKIDAIQKTLESMYEKLNAPPTPRMP